MKIKLRKRSAATRVRSPKPVRTFSKSIKRKFSFKIFRKNK